MSSVQIVEMIRFVCLQVPRVRLPSFGRFSLGSYIFPGRRRMLLGCRPTSQPASQPARQSRAFSLQPDAPAVVPGFGLSLFIPTIFAFVDEEVWGVLFLRLLLYAAQLTLTSC